MAKLTAQIIWNALFGLVSTTHKDWEFENPDARKSKEKPGIIGRWSVRPRDPMNPRIRLPRRAVGPLGEANPTNGEVTEGELEWAANHSRSLDEAVKMVYAHLTGSKPMSGDPTVAAESQDRLIKELTRKMEEMQEQMKIALNRVSDAANPIIRAARETFKESGVVMPDEVGDLATETEQILTHKKLSDAQYRWRSDKKMSPADKQAFREEFGVEPTLRSNGALDRRQLRRLTATKTIELIAAEATGTQEPAPQPSAS